ncbi:MAG TPA: DUF1552 domain-containing protein [Vicinamibacterales bacterium]|jgi:hypothetical protein|nr:DUF1552 domain-containing protein [Vicinamibacterales bacterium]
MQIRKMHLARRTFLQGLGTAVALPFLDAMVPSFTALAKTAATPQKRFGAVYIPHGAIMERYTPAKVGTGFDFTPILKPLQPYKDNVVVVSNLDRPGIDDSHATASAAWLSGAIAKKTEGQDFHLGRTVDQVIAKQIGGDTPFPSLEVATENLDGYVGGCSPGYACAYMNTISWSSETTPVPMEINPRVVFERLFGRPGTHEQRVARARQDASILDSVTEDLGDLERGLGPRDKARLDEYLDNIREIEQRIQKTEARNNADASIALDAPIGVPESYQEHVGLMFDLMAVAWQADLTRVATFMMAREASMKTYPEIGITEPHHTISHHREKPDVKIAHATLNAYHMSLFARFIGKLKATPDGDGTLLDHSLVFYGSGMSNANVHGPYPLPLVVAGGWQGKGYRHIVTKEHTPLGNLWVGVGDMFGLPEHMYGESTGRVTLV